MFELKMPKLGESVTEGTLGKWLKKPGEQVHKYDLLVEVQTDTVNTAIPSPVSGTLREGKVEQGQAPPSGAPRGACLADGGRGLHRLTPGRGALAAAARGGAADATAAASGVARRPSAAAGTGTASGTGAEPRGRHARAAHADAPRDREQHGAGVERAARA